MSTKSKAAPRKIIPIYKAEALLIPVSRLEPEEIKSAHRRFTHYFYDEKKCAGCENLEDRHSVEYCNPCAAFLGKRRTSKIVTKGDNGKEFLSLPAGGSKIVKKWLVSIGQDENYKIVDRTPGIVPLSRKIKFTGTLRDFQGPAVDSLVAKKRGILNSLPRTGKTVMATAGVCRVQAKTLIIASQYDWLRQFRETFIGSTEVPAFTDATPEQVDFCKKLSDFERVDVALCTFAQFMSKRGRQLLLEIQDMFSVIIVDEVQTAPAKETSVVLSHFNGSYFWGLSGTVERKLEGEIEIAHDLVGPIIHTTSVPRLVPKVDLLFPKVPIKEPSKSAGQAGFTYFQSRLESNSTRRRIVLEHAIKKAKAGHMVLIPMTRVASILKWTQEVNAIMGKGFAMPFYGGLKKPMRSEIVRKARAYECRILIGNIYLLSVGLNIPRASCIYESSATANIPKADQRFSRILTPMDGKPTPEIVLVLDDSDIIRRCKQKEFWGCLKPRFKPDITREDYKTLLSYFANKNSQHSVNLAEGV